MAGRLKLAAQIAALALVTGLFALLVWKMATEGDNAANELGQGKNPTAPAFHLDRLNGSGKLSLAAYRGKPVILNFWASWCIPCKEEAPLLESVWQRYRQRGLVVLGVDIQDVRGEARRFARRNGMSYPLAYDGPGNTVSNYGVTGVPETFFVGRNGKLVCERLQAGVHLEENRDRFDACVQEVLAA
jgi:cytochrome c biogenesis protein CcmG, thiol:disulfide interchange protein DsbE